MDILYPLPCSHWAPDAGEMLGGDAIAALESGKVLFFPHLAFALTQSEQSLLSPAVSNGRAKNISLAPGGRLKHSRTGLAEQRALQAMMARFAGNAATLVARLFPNYAAKLEQARTSYRPVEIAGRAYSPVKDDTRLHVDAFPTRPMRGRRILRLFANINPHGSPRVWHVGEPFAEMAQKLLPKVHEPGRIKNWALAAVGATRGVRAPYDDLMLGLHDAAKLDDEYQQRSPQIEIAFPAGTTWLCFTDQVMHAALAGQYVLEQTFHLDIDAMADPARAPVRILERMTERKLA